MTRFYRTIAFFLFFTGSFSFTYLIPKNVHSYMNIPQWGEWETAKNLYDLQKYQDALQAFQLKPLDNANYYYNLGTVYKQLTQIGPAVAYLEKANRLRPHDSDIQTNLLIARRILGQSIGVDKLDPASSALEQLEDQIPLDEMRVLLGFLGILTLLAWLRSYLKTRSTRKIFLTALGTFGLAGFILTTCIFGLIKLVDVSSSAISLQRHSVRSGPGERYSELTKLEGGTKVRLLSTAIGTSNSPGGASHEISPEENANWLQVRYSRQEVGWVKISSLLVL